MSSELRDSYHLIAQDYLQKKRQPWIDFKKFYALIKDNPTFYNQNLTVFDIGGGNGRNIEVLSASLAIVGDLSYDLLLGCKTSPITQPVALALPNLPFRQNSCDILLLIAVLHHFHTSNEVHQSLLDCRRVNPDGLFIISVWRKWRQKIKEQILERMKAGKEVDTIINHELPWHNGDGSVKTTRFYHYYTFRELYKQLEKAGIQIVNHAFLGGRSNNDNIFVLTNVL